MRSRLEADYAAALDERGTEWEYEPDCFGGTAGQWLPDFRLAGGSRPTLVEVKPAGMLDGVLPNTSAYYGMVDAFLKRMAIAWDSAPDVSLQLAFWEYGGPERMIVVSMQKGEPWLVFHGDSPPALWIGMGQYQSCITSDDLLTCRITKGHWICSCGCDVQKDNIQPDDVCDHLRALGASPRSPSTHLGDGTT